MTAHLLSYKIIGKTKNSTAIKRWKAVINSTVAQSFRSNDIYMEKVTNAASKF